MSPPAGKHISLQSSSAVHFSLFSTMPHITPYNSRIALCKVIAVQKKKKKKKLSCFLLHFSKSWGWNPGPRIARQSPTDLPFAPKLFPYSFLVPGIWALGSRGELSTFTSWPAASIPECRQRNQVSERRKGPAYSPGVLATDFSGSPFLHP